MAQLEIEIEQGEEEAIGEFDEQNDFLNFDVNTDLLDF